MQHFTRYPGPTFVCGAPATGRRNSLLDSDTSKTTCPRCQATEAWQHADAATPGRTEVEAYTVGNIAITDPFEYASSAAAEKSASHGEIVYRFTNTHTRDAACNAFRHFGHDAEIIGFHVVVR